MLGKASEIKEFRYKFMFRDFDMNAAPYTHRSEKKLSKKACKTLAEQWSKGNRVAMCSFVGEEESA